MKTRSTAFAVTLMFVVLSFPLAGFSQQPSDRGFLARKEYDLDGPAPRLSSGKPDLTGVWDRPYVRDITQSFTSPNGTRQVGEPELPLTEWGERQWENHDPANDYAGACLPYGFPRAIVARHPMQLLQHEDFIAFLFEQNSFLTLVPIDGRSHPRDAVDNPTCLAIPSAIGKKILWSSTRLLSTDTRSWTLSGIRTARSCILSRGLREPTLVTSSTK